MAMDDYPTTRKRDVTLFFSDPKHSQEVSLQAIMVNGLLAKKVGKVNDRFTGKTFECSGNGPPTALALFLLEVFLLQKTTVTPMEPLGELGRIEDYRVLQIWHGKLTNKGELEPEHAYNRIEYLRSCEVVRKLWLFRLFYKEQIDKQAKKFEDFNKKPTACSEWIRNVITHIDRLPFSTKVKFKTSVFLGFLLYYQPSDVNKKREYSVCFALKSGEELNVSIEFSSESNGSRTPSTDEVKELADRLYQVFPATERVHKELSLNHHPVTDKLSESSSEPITSKMGEDEVPYRVTEKRRLFPVLRRLYLTWWKIALAQSAVVLAVVWVTLQFVSVGNQKAPGSETEMPTLPPSKVEENSLGSEGRILELKDRHGEIAWRYTLPGNVQEYDFVDLDRDGVSEVLASVLGEDTRDGGWLLLFSLDGELIWERNLSALSIYSAKTGRLTVDYWKVGPVFRRDQLHVVVVGRDVSWALTSYLAVVDFEGNVVKRVWHPGNLHQILLAQESEDKLPLVFVRGINNHLSQPNPVDPVNPHNRCVFCLDFSVENVFQAPPYLGAGNNTIFKWYGLLFPTGPDVTKIEQADINGDGRQELGIWTLAGQVYYVSFDGEIVTIGQTDNPSGNSSFEFVDLKTGKL